MRIMMEPFSKNKASLIRFLAELVLIVFAYDCVASGQETGQKKGGVCFEFADNQPANLVEEYYRVFAKYGAAFSWGINLTPICSSASYTSLVCRLQDAGMEMLDHTPDHATQFFTVTGSKSDFARKDWVDHISGDKICLRYEFDTNSAALSAGSATLSGDTMISSSIAGFASWGDPIYSFIYIPVLGRLYTVSVVFNANSSDVDTLLLKSFWEEDIPSHREPNVNYMQVSRSDVHLPRQALAALIARTRFLSVAAGMKCPSTWLQPGGAYPLVDRQAVKSVAGEMLAYKAAYTVVDPSLLCFNEYDPYSNNAYGFMSSGLFDLESENFSTAKHYIADMVAKHRVVVQGGHLHNLLGTWTDFIARHDSALSWCRDNNVPVRTIGEWADVLYKSVQNPYVNVIPPLNVDLDDDGIPDGYSVGAAGLVDKSDGVPADGGQSIAITSPGIMCRISGLTGLEKGENDFSVWTKGASGDSVSVTISLPGYASRKLMFPAASDAWVNYDTRQPANGSEGLVIPDDVSSIDVTIRCETYKRGSVKVSGICLRKELPEVITIVSLPDTQAVAGALYSASIKAATSYATDTISYKLINAPSWLQLSKGGILSGYVPSGIEVYQVSVVMADQHGNSDILSFGLHVGDTAAKGFRIVSLPETLVAPNATYYYPVYAVPGGTEGEIRYSLLEGPDWLSMSEDGVLTGTAPKADSGFTHATVVARNQFADADTQSYPISIRPILADSLQYSDSPSDHGWDISSSGGQVRVVFDSSVGYPTIALTSSTGLEFGANKFGPWLANSISIRIRSTSEFLVRFWLIDSRGSLLDLDYGSGDGEPVVRSDNGISYYLGRAFSDGSWRTLGRSLNDDLQNVRWGATVRRIVGVSFRGTVQLSSLTLGKSPRGADFGGNMVQPIRFDLEQNYPNPFNPSTRIDYDVPQACRVTLRIYNVLGQLVRTLMSGRTLGRGKYSVTWRGDNDVGKNLGSGTYFCLFEAEPTNGSARYLRVRKLMLLR